MKIIAFLNENNGALMVLITLIYVIATIAIWLANKQSAKSSEKQLQESKRQFSELNRPYITCQYILSDRMFCGIRIQNYGNLVAKNLHIHVNEDFIDALNPKNFMDFYKVNTSVYSTVGINQYYDLHFCHVGSRPLIPIIITLDYSDGYDNQYHEEFEINLVKQLPVQSVNSDLEKLTKKIEDVDQDIKALVNLQKDKTAHSDQERTSLSEYLGVR